jgi:hypothetical protein
LGWNWSPIEGNVSERRKAKQRRSSSTLIEGFVLYPNYIKSNVILNFALFFKQQPATYQAFNSKLKNTGTKATIRKNGENKSLKTHYLNSPFQINK